jgi:predicted transposase YbfD/YdcC
LLLHPAIAESGFAALGAARSCPTAADDLPAPPVLAAELLQRFAAVSDGRRDQGRVHPVGVVLTLCAAAVVAGMGSFTAIAGWVADVPAALLAQLYRGPADRPAQPPSKATIWRVITGADAAAVDAAIAGWLAEQADLGAATAHPGNCAGAGDTTEPGSDHAGRDESRHKESGGATGGGDESGGHDGGKDMALVAIAVDGKTVRGAIDAEGNQTHLLAAATHDHGLVVGQVEVGAKTNEIPMFAPLLDRLADAGIDLAHTVITADALHAQRAHAAYLHERGAGFVFTVKHNQPALFAALDALPWAQAPIAVRDVDRGHGRITTRTIQVLPAPADLPFPHTAQAWLIERYVTDPTGHPTSAVAALGITNLTTDRAGPELLTALVRGHWGIESLHWLRDTVYREDSSSVRTQSGPRVMAALRNLGIGAHRLTGRRDITEATRAAGRAMDRPFKILKLIST